MLPLIILLSLIKVRDRPWKKKLLEINILPYWKTEQWEGKGHSTFIKVVLLSCYLHIPPSCLWDSWSSVCWHNCKDSPMQLLIHLKYLQARQFSYYIISHNGTGMYMLWIPAYRTALPINSWLCTQLMKKTSHMRWESQYGGHFDLIVGYPHSQFQLIKKFTVRKLQLTQERGKKPTWREIVKSIKVLTTTSTKQMIIVKTDRQTDMVTWQVTEWTIQNPCLCFTCLWYRALKNHRPLQGMAPTPLRTYILTPWAPVGSKN